MNKNLKTSSSVFYVTLQEIVSQTGYHLINFYVLHLALIFCIWIAFI